ncbi:hypothetical protein Tco_1236910 [Tanacetum coccineum]
MENEHELSYETLTRVYLGSYEHYKGVVAEVEHSKPGFELQGSKMVEMGRFGIIREQRIAAYKGYRGGGVVRVVMKDLKLRFSWKVIVGIYLGIDWRIKVRRRGLMIGVFRLQRLYRLRNFSRSSVLIEIVSTCHGSSLCFRASVKSSNQLCRMASKNNVVDEDDGEWICFLGGNSSSGIKKYQGSNSSDGNNIGDRVKIAGEVIGSGDEIEFSEELKEMLPDEAGK